MFQLFGQSQIITHDEELCILREGTSTPQNVSYKDGKPIKKDPTTFNITCNVQPITGRELEMVPEGDRFKEQYWVFTDNTDKPVCVGDQVTRVEQGSGKKVNFHIQTVEQWGSYQAFRMVRIDAGPRRTP